MLISSCVFDACGTLFYVAAAADTAVALHENSEISKKLGQISQ